MGNQNSVNRRNFVKAAGLATAGALATTGVAIADETHESWMPQQWDGEADAVVIGFGCAGSVATCSLADQGMSSILLEKMPAEFAGGDVSVCGGYVKKAIDADAYILGSLNGVSREWAESIAPITNESVDYLIDLGLNIDGESFPQFGMTVSVNGEPLGQTMYNGLTAAVESRSDLITVYYETPAVDLVQNPVTGEVLGVKAGSPDAPKYFKANRGVLVASGSFGSDLQMVSDIYAPGIKFPSIGSPANTGDGLKMLLKAGCKAQHFGCSLEFAAMASKVASEEVGTGITIPAAPAGSSYLFVNCKGKRFMNEEAVLQHSKDDSLFSYNTFYGDLHSNLENTGYINAPAFMVFDEAQLASGPVADVNGAGMGWNIHGLYTWSQDNQAEVEKGWIVKADTLEELAEKAVATDMWGNEVHIDADGLVEQVTRYNELCESGEDVDFDRTTVSPLSLDGPFYAMEIIPATLYTVGGASHDINGQAIDWNDNPIPRLFMAGLVGNPFTLHSSAVRGATAWARIAVGQIAQLEPWA